MRSVLSCAVTQLIVVILIEVSGQTIGPIFKEQEIQEVVIPYGRFDSLSVQF